MKDTKLVVDWYSADIEIDVFCTCGKRFTVYKREGNDKNQTQCPGCFRNYFVKPELSVQLSEIKDVHRQLEIDKNDLGRWY